MLLTAGTTTVTSLGCLAGLGDNCLISGAARGPQIPYRWINFDSSSRPIILQLIPRFPPNDERSANQIPITETTTAERNATVFVGRI